MSLKIAIGGDHAGYDLKSLIINKLNDDGHWVKDYGPQSTDAVDYPDYIHPLATAVHSGEVDFGIAICGSGHGVNMVANKHAGIRAALCWRPELAAWPAPIMMQMCCIYQPDGLARKMPKRRWMHFSVRSLKEAATNEG